MSDAAKVAPEGQESKERAKPEDVDKLKDGPIEKRSCTDILCCLIFILFNIWLVYMAILGFTTGDPLRLTLLYDENAYNETGTDHGPACGTGTLSELKYLYFYLPHPDYLNRTTCVKECPSNTTGNSFVCSRTNGCTNGVNNQLVISFNDVASSLTDISLFQTGMDTKMKNNEVAFAYDTSKYFDRLCFPSASILKGLNLTAAMSSAMSMDSVSQWVNDIKNSWTIILASVGVALVLGIIYMFFVRIFAGIIVYLCFLLYFVALVGLGIVLYMKSQELKDQIADGTMNTENPTDSGSSNQQIYEYSAYVVWGIAGVSLIVLCCMWRNIKLAIAVIKAATVYITEVPLSMMVPPLFGIITAIWWAVWIVCFLYVFTTGTVEPRAKGSIFAVIRWTQEQQINTWAFLFGGLWNNAFIGALCQFVLASSVCIWYFSRENLHKPLSRSFYRGLRYHTGSLAFGAFLLALVQFIRIILEYVAKQLEAQGAKKNKVVKMIVDCLRCYMACFERFIKFLNRNAYIQIALSGRNFCSAAKEAMRLLWANALRVAIIQGLGGVFILLGKVFITIACVFIGYYILSDIEPYKNDVSNPFFPCLIILCIAYMIAQLFMSVYGMAIDTIFMCFLYDEEMQKGLGNVKPAHLIPELEEFFENNIKK